MKKRLKFLVTLAALLGISACDINLLSDIKVSELMSADTQKISGVFDIEIANCHDYQDSRIASDALLQVQQKVSTVLPSAQYKECYEKEMNSFASFVVDMDVKPEVLNSANITLAADGKGKLGLYIPGAIMESLTQDGLDLDLHASFNIINDTNDDVTFNTASVFVNDAPVVVGSFTIKKGESTAVRLSEIWTSVIRSGKKAVFLNAVQKETNEQQTRHTDGMEATLSESKEPETN